MPAPTFDSSSVGDMGGGSLTVAHSIAASGNNRILVAFFFAGAGSNANTKYSSVQYNGVAGTQLTPDVELDEFGNYFSIQAYYWLEASLPVSSGSYNITASTTGSMWNGGVVATSWTGAQQSAPTDSGRNSDATGTPSTSTVSISVTSADEVVVDAVFGWGTTTLTASSPTAGQTEPASSQTNGGNTTYRTSQAYEVTGSGSHNQTWSFSSTCNLFLAFAVGIEGVAAGVNIETGNLANGNAGGTTSHTLTAKANRGVLVFIDDESTTQASAVTYNSVSMTQVIYSTSVVGIGNASSIWFILDANLPAGAGSYNVSVTGLDSGSAVTVVEINNVAQVIPTGSAVDNTETGAVGTSTATITAPSGNSLAAGALGHGDTDPILNPPTGTGTWVRLFNNNPSSAVFAGAYQKFTTSGSKNYTESVATTWNRSSQCLAVFAEYIATLGDNSPYFGCNF